MLSVYNYMGSGVLLTGIVALLAYNSGFTASLVGSPLMWVVALAPLAFVMVLSFGINKLSTTAAQALFWAYAAVMGLSMSTIFLVYTGTSIAQTFFATAAAFMGLSLWGYTTKKDLSGFGTFLIMGLVGLIALGAGGRGGQAVRALCVAVVAIVFVDPDMARSAGFALSVLASAGIVAWSRRWTDLLAMRMPRPLAEGICTPLAAQLATQPLVTAISGQVSVAGLVANLVSGPLVGPATVLGFLAAASAIPLPLVATWFATGAGWCAQGLCWIARLGELLPGAAISWPAGWVALLVVTAGCVGAVLVLPRLLRNPWLAAAAALLIVLSLLRPVARPGWPPHGPRWGRCCTAARMPTRGCLRWRCRRAPGWRRCRRTWPR